MQEQREYELTGRRRELLNILPALRRFALSLTGETGAADELLQASIARVLKGGLPVEAELLPCCIRVCRQLWTERRQSAGDSGATSVPASSDRGVPAGIAAADEVRPALAALSDDQRAVLELVALEGHSYGAAAAMLDVSIGGIMHRLARARGALIDRFHSGWVPAGRKAVNT